VRAGSDRYIRPHPHHTHTPRTFAEAVELGGDAGDVDAEGAEHQAQVIQRVRVEVSHQLRGGAFGGGGGETAGCKTGGGRGECVSAGYSGAESREELEGCRKSGRDDGGGDERALRKDGSRWYCPPAKTSRVTRNSASSSSSFASLAPAVSTGTGRDMRCPSAMRAPAQAAPAAPGSVKAA